MAGINADFSFLTPSVGGAMFADFEESEHSFLTEENDVPREERAEFKFLSVEQLPAFNIRSVASSPVFPEQKRTLRKSRMRSHSISCDRTSVPSEILRAFVPNRALGEGSNSSKSSSGNASAADMQNLQEKENKALPEIEPFVKTHFVFVYGTLKRGYRNHYNMKKDGIRFFQAGRTVDKLPLYLDQFNRYRPCLAHMIGTGHHVCGELFEVTNDMLAALDEFERVPTHYHRRLLPVLGEDGRQHMAHVYFNNTPMPRQGEILDGVFDLIPDYTPVDHAKYVPREGNSQAHEVEQRNRQRLALFSKNVAADNKRQIKLNGSAIATGHSDPSLPPHHTPPAPAAAAGASAASASAGAHTHTSHTPTTTASRSSSGCGPKLLVGSDRFNTHACASGMNTSASSPVLHKLEETEGGGGEGEGATVSPVLHHLPFMVPIDLEDFEAKHARLAQLGTRCRTLSTEFSHQFLRAAVIAKDRE